jgi:hypothetical protein
MPPLIAATQGSLYKPFKHLSHRLNMDLDLQSLFGLMCTAVLIGWDPATPPYPRIWARIRGCNWSAKIDEISL